MTLRPNSFASWWRKTRQTQVGVYMLFIAKKECAA